MGVSAISPIPVVLAGRADPFGVRPTLTNPISVARGGTPTGIPGLALPATLRQRGRTGSMNPEILSLGSRSGCLADFVSPLLLLEPDSPNR